MQRPQDADTDLPQNLPKSLGGAVIQFQVRKPSSKDPRQPGLHIQDTCLKTLTDQGHQGSMRKTGQHFAVVQHFLLDKLVKGFWHTVK